MARLTRRTVREAIEAHHGNLSRVADALGSSRQTVYNYINKYRLDDAVESARNSIFDIAESNIFNAVKSGDVDVSKFVVTRMPSARKWSSKSEIENEFKHSFDIPDDVADKLLEMGVDPSDAVREFITLIRENNASAD